MPNLPFYESGKQLADLSAYNQLDRAMNLCSLERWFSATPKLSYLAWFVVGGALFTVTWFARVRWSWWPLHPVLFLVWGSRGLQIYGVSFLLGYLLKAATQSLGGDWLHRRARVLALGVICGELVAAIGWILVGVVYHAVTGLTPKPYWIYSG